MKQTLTVVGAGIAGLTAAAYAARKGLDVTVLEANPDLVGGLCAPVPVSNRKVTFGPRYLWNFGEGQPGRDILEELGLDDRISFLELDADGFDRIHCDRWTDPIKVPMDWHRYRRVLAERFPQDRAGLEKFFSACEDSFAITSFIDRNLLFQQSWPNIWMHVARAFSTQPWRVVKFTARTGDSLADAFDRFGLGEDARIALSAHRLIFAEPVESLSFHAYAGATLNYMQGACFPEGGMGALIEPLVKLIGSEGGKILRGDAVRSARADRRGIIDSLTTCSGAEFRSDYFISTIAPGTLNRIFDHSGLRAPCKLPNFDLSGSVDAIFLRVSGSASLGSLTGRHNTWICESRQRPERMENGGGTGDRTAFDCVFVNCPSEAYDDGRSPEDDDRLISIFLPAEPTEDYARRDSENRSDSPGHPLIEHAIRLIEKSLGIRIAEHVVDAALYRPADIQALFGAQGGNVYGKSFSTRDVFKKIPMTTRYANLFQAGHFTSFAGVANSMQSAKFVSRHLADRIARAD